MSRDKIKEKDYIAVCRTRADGRVRLEISGSLDLMSATPQDAHLVLISGSPYRVE